jgi:heme/copper-type cytochrome/quinol oxidase subunit 2
MTTQAMNQAILLAKKVLSLSIIIAIVVYSYIYGDSIYSFIEKAMRLMGRDMSLKSNNEGLLFWAFIIPTGLFALFLTISFFYFNSNNSNSKNEWLSVIKFIVIAIVVGIVIVYIILGLTGWDFAQEQAGAGIRETRSANEIKEVFKSVFNWTYGILFIFTPVSLGLFFIAAKNDLQKVKERAWQQLSDEMDAEWFALLGYGAPPVNARQGKQGQKRKQGKQVKKRIAVW